MIHQNDQIEAPEAKDFFHTRFHKLGVYERNPVRFKLLGVSMLIDNADEAR